MASQGPPVDLALPGGDGPPLEPALVRDQLERILASPLFSKSKRCGPFLRYVVTETLGGRGHDLKERRIGTDVFHRDAAYDTSVDPVVRTTAIEVRKRLAQYYQDPAHDFEPRIMLAAGHYAPQFCLAAARPEAVEAQPAHGEPESSGADATAGGRRRWLWVSAAFAVLSLAGVLAVILRDDPLRQFWAPLWQSSDPVIIAIGDALDGSFVDVPRAAENARDTRIGFADSVAQTQVAALLQAHNKRYEIRLAGATTLTDLKHGPSILIGAFNNYWSMSLQSQLRFNIKMDANRIWIEDRNDPGNVRYSVDRSTTYARTTVDYGVVARFWNPQTQQPVLILAGLGGGATRIASEFVTNPRYTGALATGAPRDWARRNFEVLLAGDMANGAIGAPRILATHFW